MTASIEFQWNPDEFDLLYASCAISEEMIIFTDRVAKNKDDIILEAGCGSGATVKYLADMGYRNIHGIELNKSAVGFINKAFPDLQIICGDLLEMPYADDYFDSILSLGVVEHFAAGLPQPLGAMYRVLKPGGRALITVPSLNLLRRIKSIFKKMACSVNPRKNRLLRKIFNKEPLIKKRFPYYVYPDEEHFYEYRLTPGQFKKECRKAGFIIVESMPFAHLDGLYHSFGHPSLITFSDWKFHVTKAGRFLNSILRKIPYFHNHMQAIIVQKRFE